MIKWLALENYDDFEFNVLRKLNVQGVVVGDPFCSYRMFRYGDIDLFDFIKKCNQAGIQVIYQTPVYVTDRNFKYVTNNLEYLYEKLNVKKFLIQDVGLTDWLSQKYLDAELIWSHWGRNRNSIMNHDFVGFLIELGVRGIEISSIERTEAISKFGLPVYSVFGNTTYNTLSRECYNQYMLDYYDGMCGRECLQKKMILKSKSIEMTINGHLLGRKIRYPSEKEFLSFVSQFSENLMVYALNVEEAVKICEKLCVN